jgi:hypothetical protein
MSNVQLVVGKLKDFGIANALSSLLLSKQGMKINKQRVFVKYDSRRLEIHVSCEPTPSRGVRHSYSLEDFTILSQEHFDWSVSSLASHFYDKNGNYIPLVKKG